MLSLLRPELVHPELAEGPRGRSKLAEVRLRTYRMTAIDGRRSTVDGHASDDRYSGQCEGIVLWSDVGPPAGEFTQVTLDGALALTGEHPISQHVWQDLRGIHALL